MFYPSAYIRLDAVRRGRRPGKLKCKPGYVQRGAVCQPQRGRGSGAPNVGRMARAALPVAAVGGAIGAAGLGAAAMYNAKKQRGKPVEVSQEERTQARTAGRTAVNNTAEAKWQRGRQKAKAEQRQTQKDIDEANKLMNELEKEADYLDPNDIDDFMTGESKNIEEFNKNKRKKRR